MKTVFVLFDTLNRRTLECYGGRAVKTPNFPRFAERACRGIRGVYCLSGCRSSMVLRPVPRTVVALDLPIQQDIEQFTFGGRRAWISPQIARFSGVVI